MKRSLTWPHSTVREDGLVNFHTQTLMDSTLTLRKLMNGFIQVVVNTYFGITGKTRSNL